MLWVCSELHEHFPTVPEPIREYIEEVQKHLEAVTQYDGPDMSLEDKLNFLRETRHAFGRTALVLSGGGALGAFHIVSLFWMCLLSCLRSNGCMLLGHCVPCRIVPANLSYEASEGCSCTHLTTPCLVQGVVKALREQGLLPRVIAGSSVGSIGERCQPCTVLASSAR